MNNRFYFYRTGLFIALMFVSIKFYRLEAQNFTDSKTQNYFEIQKMVSAYYDSLNVDGNGYYLKNGVKQKAYGYKQYKRWEWFWHSRINPETGEFPETAPADIVSARQNNQSNRGDDNWSSIGPSTTPGGDNGLGRINCVGFRPGDANVIYAGSPSGGLWKSTDGGSSWTPLTDGNSVLGVSDVVVFAGATTATDTIYIATGDRDNVGTITNLNYGYQAANGSIGVLKSVDGGATWSTTGLSFQASDQKTTNRLIANYDNHNVLYAATSAGLYKTTDGGNSWTLLTATEFVDLEMNTSDTAILYAGKRTGGEIWLSTNGGSTWSKVYDLAGANRTELAVTEDNSDIVYAVITDLDDGLKEVAKSTNGGTSFFTVYDHPDAGNGNDNLLNSSCYPGATVGGQGNYDLAVAADPTDANTLFVGGINTWKSSDGGSSFSIVNHWNSSCGGTVDTVHADKHCLAFQNGTSVLFEGNDGGLYKTTDGGSTWTDLSNGLVISQIYRIGISALTEDELIAGFQDNGTITYSGGSFDKVLGADGFECAVDWSNDNYQYGFKQNGSMYRTFNHWSHIDYLGKFGSQWLTPFMQDPNTDGTVYVAEDFGLDKSVNRGNTWTPIGSVGDYGTKDITCFDVADGNSNYIYIGKDDELYKTEDGGATWIEITGTLPVSSSYITDIEISHDSPDTVWVSFGQYNAYGVFQTTDGGTSWSDISSGLPSVPVLSVVQNRQNTNNLELYAGTDAGVYQKVGTADWALYSSGLPNVIVTELEIFYNTSNPENSKIYAATWGRGVWKSDLPLPPPVADFSADNVSVELYDTVSFTDLSTASPTAWFWNVSPSTVVFTGGTSQTSQNPKIRFDETGTYTISLWAENSAGGNQTVKTDYITVTEKSYCSAKGGSSSASDEYISGVEFGTISNLGTGYDEYTDYSNLCTDITINQAQTLTLTIANWFASDDIGVWIDWNKDGDFDDANENVVCGVRDNGPFDITPPDDALLGKTRMRIRLKYDDEDCGQPCGDTYYGEVEDYRVNVLPREVTWTGNTSSDWHEASNWSNNMVPTASFNVTVPSSPAGGRFPVVSDASATAVCNDLTLESGASLEIQKQLTVNGTLTNNSEDTSLVVVSNASTTGSLINNTDGAGAKVQRYVEDGEWHLIGAPVTGCTVNSLFFNHDPDVWLREYNESDDTWQEIINLTTPMPNGKGFLIWLESATRSDETIDFTGPLKGTSFTFNAASTPALSYHSGHGYNLIANPYPCSLDWDWGAWTKTGIDGSVWVWNPASGSYATRNAHGMGSLTAGIIPMGQGFFIRTTSASAELTIPVDAKTHNDTYYKSAKNKPWTYFVFKVKKESKEDEIWLTLNSQCTTGFDNGWDVLKMFSGAGSPQLWFIQDTLFLSINALPGLSGTIDLPLGFKAGENGIHNFIFAAENKSEGIQLILEDLKENTRVDLKKDPVYSFYSTVYQPPERFVLHVSKENTSINKPVKTTGIKIFVTGKNILEIVTGKRTVSENLNLKIVDMSGKTVFDKIYPAYERYSIPLNLPPALYIAVINLGSNHLTEKILIK